MFKFIKKHELKAEQHKIKKIEILSIDNKTLFLYIYYDFNIQFEIWNLNNLNVKIK